MIEYFIHTNITIAVLYCVYVLLFANSTFHALNRIVLLSIVMFSLILPFLEFKQSLFHINQKQFEWINDFNEFSAHSSFPIKKNTSFSMHYLLVGIYLSGLFFFASKFIYGLNKLITLQKKSIITKEENFIICRSEACNSPFSFFKYIFLPLKEEVDESILIHEKAHSQQKHSVDIFIFELLQVAFWFNPFFFLLKRSLKLVHEYLADSTSVKDDITLEKYVLMLSYGTNTNNFIEISHNFKSSTIRKRVSMLTKNTSSKPRMLTYLFIFPISFFILQAFTCAKSENSNLSLFPVKGGVISVEFGFKGTHPVTGEEWEHKGIDIKAKKGTPIYSAGSGTVVKSALEDKWGNIIIIKHGNNLETWYSHLESRNVDEGDEIASGSKIGAVGSTGYSTGPHLHLEVRKNGERVNPMNYVKQ